MSNPRALPSRWSTQFIGVFESLGMGAQFQRGRRYARAGQVVQLTISASLVVAVVRGEDEQAYRARIAVRAFSAADWTRVERALAGQAYYAAKLLAGQIPADIDQVFAGFGLALFPEGVGDVAMDCSCDDWQVPCGHLTAVIYTLAESFDVDPFGIFAWRGRGREELLERLRATRLGAAAKAGAAAATAGAPKPADLAASFWGSAGELPARPQPLPGVVRRPDALLDQLEPLPLSVDGQPVTELLRPVYRAIVDGSGV